VWGVVWGKDTTSGTISGLDGNNISACGLLKYLKIILLWNFTNYGMKKTYAWDPFNLETKDLEAFVTGTLFTINEEFLGT
jgi:hypothetical protein